MRSRTIAILPARLASTRLPRKPLADLGGLPLIVRAAQNVKASGQFSTVVVACDSEAVQQPVEAAGFTAILTAPELPSGTDRIAAAATALGLRKEDFVVNVQGDEPFLSASTLQRLTHVLHQYPDDIATAVVPLYDTSYLHNPNVVKVALGTAARALYFSRAAVPFRRDAEVSSPPAHAFRHLGLYGFRVDTLLRISQYHVHPLEAVEKLEQLRWLAHGETIRCAHVEEFGQGIDTPDDLTRARAYFEQHEE